MFKPISFFIRILLIMVIVFSWSITPASAQTSTKSTCDGITEIPVSECQVLLEIYNDFGMSNWGGPNA